MMDKTALLAAKRPTRTVTIPTIGEDGAPSTATVTVRGLSRAEWINVGKISGPDPSAEQLLRSEAYILEHTMTDPTVTYDEASEFLATAPHTVTGPILEAIMEASGLREDAQKEAYKSA